MFEFAALLAAIDDLMLGALIATLDHLPGTLPALQAWLEHAARWEFDRRSGFDYPLQPPTAAISPDELPAAVEGSARLGNSFCHERRPDVSPIVAFFDRLKELLLAAQERDGAVLH
ncbi:MAG TPA: hypothetical protein VLU54_09410 [Casimicrobiaceae bacterium]|nr:hypothetical protein [Casimicrobiaceae bacterium]